jgi:predicted MFS family arabinose efflux permease
MQLFKNSAINRVYLHSAIQALAETGGGVFVFVFLLKAGVPLPLVLCSVAAITLMRYILRRFVLPLARKIGLRRALILGTLLESSTYLLLPWVKGVGIMLALMIVIGAMASCIYWTCYHAYVAGSGDEDARGGQVGAIEALNAVIGAIAPGVFALLLIGSAPFIAFGIAAALQMLSAVPLMRAPDVEVPHETDEGSDLRRFGAQLYFADGLAVSGTHFGWNLALFLTLGERFSTYGGVLVIAGLAGACMSLTVGRLVDLGHGQRSVWIAYALAIAATIAKAFSFDLPSAAIGAAAFGAIAAAVQIPVMMTRLYALAKQSSCPLRFHIATEGGWDLGSATGCLLAAFLIWQGVAPDTTILIAVVGLGAAGWMLQSSYADSKIP